MTDTLANVSVPVGDWVDVYSATGIAVGTVIEIQNVGDSAIHLCTRATQPPRNFDAYNVAVRGEYYLNDVGDSGAWIKSIGQAGKINVAIVSNNSDGDEAFISAGNTSTDTLGADETFTGEWELNTAVDVQVTAQSSSDGTLFFDFSIDGGVTFSTFPVAGFEVAGGINEIHNAVKGIRSFRVRFVNGDTAQTYFRLQTEYGRFRQLNAPLNQSIGLDSDAVAVRPSNFQDEVRRGLRSEIEGWNKFGYRNSLSDGVEQLIWASSVNAIGILTTPSTYTITYNNAVDGSAQSGARTITFYDIDDDGLPAIRTHVLGSTGSDVTSFSGLGINRAVVSANGGLTYNADDITITATSDASIQAVIPALGGVTQQSVFHFSSNGIGVIPWIYFNVQTSNKAKVIALRGYVYNRAVNGRFEVFRGSIDTSVQLELRIDDPIEFKTNPSDVLYFTAPTRIGGAAANIINRFSHNEYQRT